MAKYYARMLKLMELKNYSPNTITTYLLRMKHFSEHHRGCLEELSEEDIINYLHYLRKEQKVSTSTVHVAHSVIRFFYRSVLEKELDFSKIPFPKSERKLPVVLDIQEIKNLLDVADNLKHKTILMTAYSCGLRISEITHLQPADIDSKRMHIFVKKGKGKKDRYVVLCESLLNQLRLYYKNYKPGNWLFPGEDKNKPISRVAIQRTFKKYKKKPVLPNRLPSTPYAIAMPPIF